MELLLGCGNSRKKQVTFPQVPSDWTELVTLDIDPSCKPDVVFDLSRIMPPTCALPFPDCHFDEIHAYEVLEHIGQQGDYRAFFAQFEEFWRILKPGGFLVASCPMWDSPWAWSDPGHTRVLSKHTLSFLSQAEYAAQVGQTAMTDYRHIYKGDFETFGVSEKEHNWGFVLKAIK